MKHALKERDCTIEALGKGHIVAIWRTDGIDENFNNIRRNEVLLFPTFTHQSQEKIKKEFHLNGSWNLFPNKDNQIKIKYWAKIERMLEVKSIEQLLNISSELINTNEYLVSSWNLYPNHKGKLFLLRVYLLSDPVLITNSKSYNGCNPWAELNINIPKIGSKAVLSFKDFSQRIRYIQASLEQRQDSTTLRESFKCPKLVVSRQFLL